MSKLKYIAYVTQEVTKGKEVKTYWNRVGVAFNHEKNDGLTIIITPGISVTGKIVLLEPKDKEVREPGPLDWGE